jgi:hypothetical protein
MDAKARHLIMLLTATIFAAVMALAAAPASAHEHEHVGAYELTVGWRDEPAVLGAVNGLDLAINHEIDANTSEPVLGADQTLNVTLSTGGLSTPKSLEPQFGRPGWYGFDVILTREGAYSVHIVGSVNGTAVDVTVAMDPPAARSDLEFPVSDPSPADLEAAQAANATAQQAALNKLQANNAAVQAQASTAMMVGIGGLLAGAAGLAVGAFAMRRGQPKP